MGDNRPMRYVEDNGLIVYRASSLGYCPRAFVALANGMTPTEAPQWLQTAWREGVELEDKIIQKFTEKTGHQVDGSQQEVELVISYNDDSTPRIVVRGHMDGRVPGHAVDAVLEVKKVAPSSWYEATKKRVESNVLYPWQLSVYMHATGGDAYFVQGRMKKDKSGLDIDEVEVSYYPDAPISLKAIFDRVKMIERLISEGVYPTDVPCTTIYPCGFYFLHDEDAPEPPERLPVEPWLLDGAAQVATISERLSVLDAETKELKKQKEALDSSIKAWLTMNGLAEAGEVELALGDDSEDKRVFVVKRTKYLRAPYEVKEAEVDWISIATPEGKAAKAAATKEKAAATRAKNKAAKEASGE